MAPRAVGGFAPLTDRPHQHAAAAAADDDDDDDDGGGKNGSLVQCAVHDTSSRYAVCSGAQLARDAQLCTCMIKQTSSFFSSSSSSSSYFFFFFFFFFFLFSFSFALFFLLCLYHLCSHTCIPAAQCCSTMIQLTTLQALWLSATLPSWTLMGMCEAR